MKWQPIETAPKNGTYILVGKAGFTEVKIVFHGDCGWYDGHGGMWRHKAFSHWMALPEPPQEGE